MPKSQKKAGAEEPAFRLFGILGFPLSHTLSPKMQEAAFEKRKIKAFYAAIELEPADLKKFCTELNRSILEGFNVTVPYKQEILKYLDRVTPEAQAVGAVNTVYKEQGRWVGTNTDVHGFLTSLKQEGGVNPQGKTALVFGAGGAARAVLFGLATCKAARVTISNRHLERAEKLCREFKKIFPQTVFETLGKSGDLKKKITEAHLVVNATSLGLKASDGLVVGQNEIPSAKGRSKLFFDLIYHETQTKFLKAAKSKGHKTLNGLGMLLHQGAKAFELWSGKKAPLEVMRKALQAGLKEKKK